MKFHTILQKSIIHKHENAVFTGAWLEFYWSTVKVNTSKCLLQASVYSQGKKEFKVLTHYKEEKMKKKTFIQKLQVISEQTRTKWSIKYPC